tara:strand:+ start:261 stop:596 length:336 start_codon:yes stop_codon:yes gene_type:complete
MAVENQAKNDRFDTNKKFLKNFHQNVLSKGKSGKDGEKVVTMKIASIGLAPDKHYLLPRFDPETGEVITDNEKLLEKYMPFIESGRIKSYSSPEEAEKDRKIMYPQIIGRE